MPELRKGIFLKGGQHPGRGVSLAGIYTGQNLFFEVLVTHRVDINKENIYKNGEHKSVEIDLQNYLFTTREDLEKEILKNCNNKRIIFWEKNVVEEKSNDNSWILWLVLGVLAFFGLKSLFQRRK
jgi:hypothetical protein